MECHCPKCDKTDIELCPETGIDFDNKDGGFWMSAKCYSCGEQFLVWCELTTTYNEED